MALPQYGLVVGPLGAVRNIVPVARAAEEAGFAFLGLGDNQSLWQDVFIRLTLAAEATSTIRLGPCVTNLVTRHIAVTASAVATLDEVSGGRAFLGLGSGDSAVLALGERPSRLADLEAGVRRLRGLLAGDSDQLRWRTAAVPICVAAEGPRSLRLAGRVADRVFASFGLNPGDIRDANARIADGARDAGRDPNQVEVWHSVRVSVADDPHEALAGARVGMASVAHHALRVSPEAKGVPTELVPAIRELNARYSTAKHAGFGDNPNARLVEELGLMPYLAARYAIAGTPAECAARLAGLVEMGARRLLLMFAGTDVDRQVLRWHREVVPAAALDA